MTKTAVSYWESGRVSLSKTACLLAEHLYGISAVWLLEGRGPMWLPATKPSTPSLPDLVLRPLLPEKDAFAEDGSVIRPRNNSPCLGLTQAMIDSLLAACGSGDAEDLYFIRITDGEMTPILSPGDWALVHTGWSNRSRVSDNALYLVRPPIQGQPHVRRVAVEPLSGDLLIGVDTPGHVPLRISLPAELPAMLLGKVCWVGGQR